jgi:hypothetical protein
VSDSSAAMPERMKSTLPAAPSKAVEGWFSSEIPRRYSNAVSDRSSARFRIEWLWIG